MGKVSKGEETDGGQNKNGSRSTANARIVDEDVNVAPRLGQAVDKPVDGGAVADVELDRQHLDLIGAELLGQLVGDLAQRVDAARRQDQAQTAGRRRGTCKLKGAGAADAGRRARDDDGLAGKALGRGRHGCEGVGDAGEAGGTRTRNTRRGARTRRERGGKEPTR